jgi:hypothetical protein
MKKKVKKSSRDEEGEENSRIIYACLSINYNDTKIGIKF